MNILVMIVTVLFMMVANLQAGKKEKYYYKFKWCFFTSIDLSTTGSVYRLDKEFAYMQCVFIVFNGN